MHTSTLLTRRDWSSEWLTDWLTGWLTGGSLLRVLRAHRALKGCAEVLLGCCALLA
jgi:hypothetical protein